MDVDKLAISTLARQQIWRFQHFDHGHANHRRIYNIFFLLVLYTLLYFCYAGHSITFPSFTFMTFNRLQIWENLQVKNTNNIKSMQLCLWVFKHCCYEYINSVNYFIVLFIKLNNEFYFWQNNMHYLYFYRKIIKQSLWVTRTQGQVNSYSGCKCMII